MKERSFSKIGQGRETDVFSSSKDGVESPVVVKRFKRPYSDEYYDHLDRETATDLRERYNALVEAYPGYIARQWVMPLASEPEKYYLSQEKIDLAEVSDVFDYEIGELPEAAAEDIREIAKCIKQQWQQSIDQPDSLALPLDLLGKANLVITKDGRAKYVDTAYSIRPFAEMSPVELRYDIVARTAWLEMLAGVQPSEFRDQAFYADMFSGYNGMDFRKNTGSVAGFFSVVKRKAGRLPSHNRPYAR